MGNQFTHSDCKRDIGNNFWKNDVPDSLHTRIRHSGKAYVVHSSKYEVQPEVPEGWRGWDWQKSIKDHSLELVDKRNSQTEADKTSRLWKRVYAPKAPEGTSRDLW